MLMSLTEAKVMAQAHQHQHQHLHKQVARKTIVIKYCSTDEIPANLLIKGLTDVGVLDISLGFEPEFTPLMTPQVDMLMSGVPPVDLNISGLSLTMILKWLPKCLDDTYEGLIGLICDDYNNENKSDQSRLGVLEDNEREDDPNAMSLIHETVTKSCYAVLFIPLQVQT
jgi:hypothetical protein